MTDFLRSFSWQFYLLLKVFARNLLRRNTFRISFWCLACGSNPGFSSNKPTHYLLDHGDFKDRIVLYISYALKRGTEKYRKIKNIVTKQPNFVHMKTINKSYTNTDKCNELITSQPSITSVWVWETWIIHTQRKRTSMCKQILTNKYIEHLNQQQ